MTDQRDTPPPPPPPGPATDTAPPASPADPPLGRRLLTGAVWGPVAIGAGTLLEMWNAAEGGSGYDRPLRLLTALVVGDTAWVDTSPFLGLAINIVLGALIGLLFAAAVPRIRSARGVLVGALVLGAGVFVVDRYVLTPLLSEALVLRDPVVALASKLVMGAVLAVGFLDRR